MDSEIYLETMTDAQFEAYAKHTCASYARTSPNYRDVPFELALPEVEKQFRGRLPEGPRTKDAFLLAILLREGEQNRQIGFFDIGRTKLHSEKAYIWNVELDSTVRGRGFGKRALALAEEFLRQKGIKRVGLNVFAENTVARALYEAAGFTVTQMNMEKEI